MLKGNKLYSILFNKCPRCHQGDFFITKSAYNRRFDKMHQRCSVCGQDFEPEPGFYTGALYVSYALYVAWTIGTFVLFYVLLNIDVMVYMWCLLPSLVILTPYFFRMARRVWINIFVAYNPANKK
ncbi:uncharacterized protein (DUF983 family) [Larkinella arboricola]|uniref:Uncharacterized protein (DUF983 family) n=1 Tax=Larkinella arboricola TaxID=643671 RepID=A0A327WM37_LARAB|nr:DUF983 domain-containing protein [Larkinella arboricola]RAJ93083.1 uncharacterized protein (DUF983 family) [Larkinella arboricola]